MFCVSIYSVSIYECFDEKFEGSLCYMLDLIFLSVVVMRKTKTVLLVLIISFFTLIKFVLKISNNEFCGEFRGPNQKVISFSYFGHLQAYQKGLIQNAIKIPQLYGSNWVMRVYTNDSFSDTHLKYYSHVDICKVSLITFNGLSAEGMYLYLGAIF